MKTQEALSSIMHKATFLDTAQGRLTLAAITSELRSDPQSFSQRMPITKMASATSFYHPQQNILMLH